MTEPSGDDTLTELIVIAFANIYDARTKAGKDDPTWADKPIAEARTQLLQYIEGEKLEAERNAFMAATTWATRWQEADKAWHEMLKGSADEAAEQRQRLRGEG